MFFECRTFNKYSEEKGIRNLEALINVEDKRIDFVKDANQTVRPVLI